MENQYQYLIDAILSSSSDSSDDEIHQWLLMSEKRETPKIKNYIENVVYLYTNEEVSLVNFT